MPRLEKGMHRHELRSRTPVGCSAWLGVDGFIESAETSPKFFVSVQSELDTWQRVVNALKVRSALVNKVVFVSLLIGFTDQRWNVVKVLRLNGAVFEMPESG